VARDRRGARVVVAGAGIVGAAVAYHLARRGACVVVLERAQPGSGATGSSFAWINATFSKEPRSYFELHRLALDEWRRLSGELELAVRFGGTVEWYPPGAEAERLRGLVRRHRSWGSPVEEISEERLRSLLPLAEPGPVGAAAFTADEGWGDPVAVAATLLAAVKELGGELRLGTPLEAIDASAGALSAVTPADRLPCDHIVLACGVDTPPLAATVGIEVALVESPGALVHTAPLPHLLDRVMLAPGVHAIQRENGAVVAGLDFSGGDAAADGEALLACAARFLPALTAAALDRVTRGRRVYPRDGLPIVGRSVDERVHVVATHSGVSLAPVLGRLVAGELVDGDESDLLAPYRPDRFATPPKAVGLQADGNDRGDHARREPPTVA
jgi:glycine/D-amino acid oxidase-like deaminating enzyme